MATPNYGFEKRQKELAKKKKKEEKLKQKAADKAAGIVSPDDASDIHGVLRRALVSRLGEKAAGGVPILYGGSVNRGNAATLLAAHDVDGLLVGGASLDPDVWSGIVRS